MDEDKIDETQELSLLRKLRKHVFPVTPGDTMPVKMIKHSAFYLFAIMLFLISAAIVVAIAFVL